MTAPAETTAIVLQTGTVTQVPIDMLCRDPDQPRVEIPAASLKAMAADIAARGIELPIVVRGDFVIKDGERRWRAALLAGLETVPCILAAPMTNENGAVEWRLDQVADNHHREPLNALDWARVLRELVEIHQIAVKDIPDLLKARGIEMSRPYISNLIRLNDLPDWAKVMIASGVLPPAAGKYILMATGHEPAMAKLHELIENETKRLEPGHTLRADINWHVRRAFTDTATELSAYYGTDKPRFPWQSSCKNCTKRSQVDGEHFCLDRSCYDEKQTAADVTAEAKSVSSGQSTINKRKADPHETERKRQQIARTRARETAIAKVLAVAEKNNLTRQDRQFIAKAMVREMQQDSLKKVFTSRGWEPKKKQYGRDYYGIADRQIDKLNEIGLDCLLMECALRGALNVGFFSAGVDYLGLTAKRYRIDIKSLEKTALTELKQKQKAPAPKSAATKKKPAKSKEAKR